MNKTWLLTATLVASISATPAVIAAESGSGCGIGKMIFEGKSGKSTNLVASILNTILIPNTFFMSTAASMGEAVLGCDPSKVVHRDQQEVFVAANMENLSQEMAQGQGAHLDALAAVIGIEETDKSAFFTLTQEEYPRLFPTAQPAAGDLLASLNDAMADRPNLAKYIR